MSIQCTSRGFSRGCAQTTLELVKDILDAVKDEIAFAHDAYRVDLSPLAPEADLLSSEYRTRLLTTHFCESCSDRAGARDAVVQPPPVQEPD